MNISTETLNILSDIHKDLGRLISELQKSAEPVTEKAEAVSKPEPTEEPISKVKKPLDISSRKERESAESVPSADDDFTEEDLDKLSYNNLKKLAKDLGISATGARDELTAKILEMKSADSDSDVEEKTDIKKSKSSPKPLGKKSEPEVSEEEPEEELDPVEKSVNEAVKDMTDEEIADFLTDVGVRAKGKRQALIAAVVKAVREGKIELDDSDDEEEEEKKPSPAESKSSKKDTKKEEPVEEEEDDEEYSVNDPENPNMPDKRREAVEDFINEANSQYGGGEITDDDMREWAIENELLSKSEAKKMSGQELLDLYIDVSCNFIDDEGETVEEEGAYSVNGVPYCCGKPLKYNKDNKTYICETCGSEYEDD